MCCRAWQGLIPTFHLTLPELFIDFLANLNFIDYNVPVDCIYQVNFYVRLMYKTLTPFIAILFLYL